jgi:hypothetical protein
VLNKEGKLLTNPTSIIVDRTITTTLVQAAEYVSVIIRSSSETDIMPASYANTSYANILCQHSLRRIARGRTAVLSQHASQYSVLSVQCYPS